MSCCGQQRAAMAGMRAGQVEERAPVLFSYAGVRAIAVRGSATGRVYRFAPGALLRVQGGDAPSMQQIPGLRQLNGTQ
ncbi:MAG: hypothetical protein WBE72_01160 [Terracidiphilus sp.]